MLHGRMLASTVTAAVRVAELSRSGSARDYSAAVSTAPRGCAESKPAVAGAQPGAPMAKGDGPNVPFDRDVDDLFALEEEQVRLAYIYFRECFLLPRR